MTGAEKADETNGEILFSKRHLDRLVELYRQNITVYDEITSPVMLLLPFPKVGIFDRVKHCIIIENIAVDYRVIKPLDIETASRLATRKNCNMLAIPMT